MSKNLIKENSVELVARKNQIEEAVSVEQNANILQGCVTIITKFLTENRNFYFDIDFNFVYLRYKRDYPFVIKAMKKVLLLQVITIVDEDFKQNEDEFYIIKYLLEKFTSANAINTYFKLLNKKCEKKIVEFNQKIDTLRNATTERCNKLKNQIKEEIEKNGVAEYLYNYELLDNIKNKQIDYLIEYSKANTNMIQIITDKLNYHESAIANIYSSLNDIYSKIEKNSERIKQLNSKLNRITDRVDNIVGDFEYRINKLENPVSELTEWFKSVQWRFKAISSIDTVCMD